MWQAEHVRFALHKLYPSCDVKILGMTTRGDQILDRTLSKVGGKGLFVKELEAALADARPEVRQNVAWALGKLGAVALPGLRKALAVFGV